MSKIYKAKVVGLNFNHVKNTVTTGDAVLLMADTTNEYDKDAIKVVNSDNQVLGFIANSERTLSIRT